MLFNDRDDFETELVQVTDRIGRIGLQPATAETLQKLRKDAIALLDLIEIE